MERREFLVSAAAVAGFSSVAWAQAQAPAPAPAAGQGRGQGRGGAAAEPVDPGKPGPYPAAKIARVAIMTLNFTAETNRDPMKIAQMYQDVYGVPNVEFQHGSIPSTETSYLKELRAAIEKSKSRMTQINLEIGPMFTSAPDPVLRLQCVDLTKRWVDHAVILNCPHIMLNQGTLNQGNKDVMIEALTNVGKYAKSKNVRISFETRGGGGGGRGRAGAPADPSAPVPPPPPPAWILLNEVIEKSGVYSNIDIGGAGAPTQEALHAAAQGMLKTNGGHTHMKFNTNWDVPTFVKFYEGLGYKGIYTIEVSGHVNCRRMYDQILQNI